KHSVTRNLISLESLGNGLNLSRREVRGSNCTPRSNIVFIKAHKCASSSLQNIFIRYGYTHDKVFVLPAKGNYLGHPSLFRRSIVPNASVFGHEYNILTHHSRLNYEEMRALMPRDTLFLTIVRHPVPLFESMVNYFGLEKFFHMKLRFLGKSSRVSSKAWKSRYYGKLGLNQMLFDFGINSTHLSESTVHIETVKKHIKKLDRVFDLVMVAEYMDESLILLKNLLCWEMDDIVALKVNARTKKQELSKEAKEQIKALNWPDLMLYVYFEKKLKLQIMQFGEDAMKKEIVQLKKRVQFWYDFCVEKEYQRSVYGNKVFSFKGKNLNHTTCYFLTTPELTLTEFIRKKQLQQFPGSVYTEKP
ncbi:galactosylceramide sulfotransferase-like protein, partial [Dinothrombium tinctorium]